MATNRAMLKEAIADAKAVKETAIANAKAALEEAFTPQLKSMLSMKLQEMESEEEEIDEAGFGSMDPEGHGNIEDESSLYEEKDMMEVDLEELLAELNEEEDEMEEGLYEAEEGEDEMSDEEEADEEGEPLELEDMTDEDLKDMIEDVIKDMIESGELEAGHEEGEEEEGEEEEMSDEEEVDLAELLREIEEMDEMEEPVDEIFGLGKKGGRDYKTVIAQLMADNDAVIKAIAAETDPAKKKAIADPLLKKAFVEFGKLNKENPAEKVIDNMSEFKREVFGDSRSLLQKLAAGSKGSVSIAREGMEEELAEAYSTIETLKNELNEINLLNAKLLYSNKIFKSKNLNESQKVKVLSSFDKANTVGEVKMVFETLNEGIKVNKTTIKENLGSASKTTGAPTVKKPIVESNDAFLRMQKLAGLI
jgi:S-DNA-T family DNA segregation ATPase FtsK/SpoIIIE